MKNKINTKNLPKCIIQLIDNNYSNKNIQNIYII